ncbi:TlpA family protein disulfide reductase [Oceanirhabdus sp. W0125-5]|uniref:TlpA family protein disulfide reductase n=1 Tax=Oceanirhabdus sp. W0125-5 TaxID=2999116 RepID=UPI0022F2DBD4|nr:TlpA disulfide reductase family protein [Oceanirhabdus sp. W0125-5]WBW98320.1 TlpA disulfide reductase family protein [Oceanirhabdus sp. W0125-5]
MNKKIKYGLISIVVIGGLFVMKKAVDDYNMNNEPKSYEVQLESNDKKEEKKEENNIEKNHNVNKDNIEEERKQEEKNEEETNKDQTAEEKIEYNQDINFTLKDLDGNEVSISDFQGKKVFINFWATWCPSCKVEMPDMQKIWEEFGEEVVVVAVDIGESKDTVQKYIDKEGYTFKVLLDVEKVIGQKFGITAIPTSILLDENGNLIYGVKGAMPYESMVKFVKGELRKNN